MRYLVAVSGGVDSVVLLDMLVRQGEHELVVAHFDHGTRKDSAADARFVAGLAGKYGLPFVTKREELGEGVSEDLARQRRYTFLRSEAKRRKLTIATAHHDDDVLETIAINLIRGTGWRGVAVLDSASLARPLLGMNKRDVYAYALQGRLEWVEDSTNAGDVYLRNRLRRSITRLLSGRQKRALLAVWQQQKDLKRHILAEMGGVLGEHGQDRYFFIMAETGVARELLRELVFRASGSTPTYPQAGSALLAIKTARPGSVHQIGRGVALVFDTRSFIVKTSS